jgi:Uma2 family endonuclease
MATQTRSRITPEEYLAVERQAETKSEYLNGEIFAMSGASPEHVLIATNVVAALHGQLKNRDYTVYASDLRVKVSPTGLYTYSDVTVICGKGEFEASEDLNTLLNPILIIEVLSPSTQDDDRGRKFEHYRTIETFREYVLIAQDKVHVEHFVRQSGTQWLFSETSQRGDTIRLELINCELALTEVYAKIELSA